MRPFCAALVVWLPLAAGPLGCASTTKPAVESSRPAADAPAVDVPRPGATKSDDNDAEQLLGSDADALLERRYQRAHQRGFRETAVTALRRRLEHARTAAALAELGLAPGIFARTLGGVEESVARHASDLHDPWLLSQAIEGRTDLPPHLEAVLLESLLSRGWLSDETTERLVPRIRSDPKRLAELAEIVGRQGGVLQQLDDDTVLRLGPRGARVLRARLYAIDGADRDKVAAAAKQLRTADPHDFAAGLIELLLSEWHHLGRSPRDGLVADVLGNRGGWVPTPTLLRLEHDRLAFPRASSLRLAFAARAIDAGLAGDARAELAKLEKANPRGLARRLLDQALAMTALVSGDLRAFDAWRAAHPEPSAFLDDLIERTTTKRGGEELRKRMRARKWANMEQASLWDARAALTDADVPPSTRTAAARRLSTLSPHQSQIGEACLHVKPEDCAQLWEAVDALDDPSEAALGIAEALFRLRAMRAFDPTWLDALTEADPSDAEKLAQTLRAIGKGDIGRTPSYARAYLLWTLASNRGADALVELEKLGAVLPDQTRLRLWLAASAQRDHGPPADHFASLLEDDAELPAPPSDDDALTDEERSNIEGEHGGTDVRVRYERARAYFRAGGAALAAREIEALIADVPAQMAPQLWAEHAHAALAAGDLDGAARSLQKLERERPRGFAAAELTGRLEAKLGHHEQAVAAYARALLLRPGNDEVLSRLLRSALDKKDPLADARVYGVAVRFERVGGTFATLARLSKEPGSTASVRDVLDAGKDVQAALRLPPSALDDSGLAWQTSQLLWRHVERSPSAAEAVDRARQVLAKLRAPAKTTRVAIGPLTPLMQWSAFLAADEQALDDLTRQGADLPANLSALMVARTAGAGDRLDDAEAFAVFVAEQKAGSDNNAGIAVLQKRSQLSAELAYVLCRMQVSHELADAAVGVCAEAWRKRNPRAPWFTDLAVAASWTCLNRPEASADAGLDVRQVLDIDGSQARGSALSKSSDWLFNRALWLADHERPGEAAKTLLAAARQGQDVRQLNESLLAAVATTPTVLGRQLLMAATSSEVDPLVSAVYLGMVTGDLAVAGRYLDMYKDRVANSKDRAAATVSLSLEGVLSLLTHDLAKKALRVSDLASVLPFARMLSQPETQELARRFPRSHLVAMLRAELLSGTAPEEALTVLEPLLRQHPDNAAVVVDAITVCMISKRQAQGRTLLDRALARGMRHRVLLDLDRALPRGGQPLPLPAWLADPAAFEPRWQSLEAGDYLRLSPRRHVDVEQGIEVFVPTAFEASPISDLKFENEQGASVSVNVIPRPYPCTPADCLKLVRPQFERVGQVLWDTEVETPLGRGQSMLLRTGSATLLVVVVPFAERMFLIAGQGIDGSAETWSAFRLAVDSVRPLGAVIAANRAEALRGRLWNLENDEVRLRVRLEAHAMAGMPCDASKLLSGVKSAAAKADMLADVFLSAVRPSERLTLASCVAPTRPEAARLVLPALMSDEAAVHRFGAAAAEHHATQLVWDAETTLVDASRDRGVERPSDVMSLAPRGVLEVLAALPPRERTQLARAVLQSGEEAHAMVLAGAWFKPDLVPSDVLTADLRSADPAAATLAALSLGRETPAEVFAVARGRLERTLARPTAAEARLAVSLGNALLLRLSPDDTPVFAQLAKQADKLAVGTGDGGAQARRLAALHACALRLRAGARCENDARSEVEARDLLDRLVPEPAERRADPGALSTAALIDLLPVGDWFVARLERPDLALVTLSALFRDRLAALPAADRLMFERAIALWGAELLTSTGGLDLGRPIECARRPMRGGFFCSAWVKDADRVRDILDRRPVGGNAGTAMVLEAAQQLAASERSITGLPFDLQARLTAPPETSWPRSPRRARERVRSLVSIGGVTLEHAGTVEVRETGAIVDHEHYLFIGDRLFVFAGAEYANLVLKRPFNDADALSRLPAVQEATRTWNGAPGASRLRTLWIFDGHLSDRNVAEGAARWLTFTGEAYPDRNGVSFHFKTPEAPATPADLAPLLRHLPAEAATVVSHLDPAERKPVPGQRSLLPIGTPPPDWLIASTRPFVLGWYPQPGAALWSHWSAATSSGSWEKELQVIGLPRLTNGESAVAGPLHLARQGDVLMVATSAELLKRAQAGSARAAERSPVHAYSEATPEAALAFVEGLSAQLGKDAGRVADLRFVFKALQPIRAFVAFRGTDGLTRGRLDLETPASATGVRSPEASLRTVDEWLSSARLRNTIALPRVLSPSETTGRLRYVLRLGDSARVAARLRGRRRIEATPRSDSLLSVVVAPSSSTGQAATPLAENERRSLLRDEFLIEVSSRAVRRTAEDIAPAELPPAEAAQRILRWVHKNMRYEITPHPLGAVELLASRRGDCSEYTVLAVSLLRARGIPAEPREGLMASEGHMVAHAWVAYHDGARWHESDPTNGLLEVGAGHLEIPLDAIVGDLAAGRLAITQVDR